VQVVSVVGARPQFVKAAVVSHALRKNGAREILVHTGQHYDENMSDIFFEELEIPKPDVHLGIGSGSHGAQTGRMLEAIEKVLMDSKPDAVLVYGDTNSTLAGALAAAKLNLPIAHVEAGLRSFNRTMPEEVNRVLTDHLSNWLFVPTDTAVRNLKKEGVDAKKIHKVGDVMYDVALAFGKKAREKSRILEQLELKSRSYILATIHRPENTDNPKRLRSVFEGLSKVELPVIVPLHPRTRAALAQHSVTTRARIIDPVGYLDMLRLEQEAALIATDSGGVQKEAYFYRVPCVTLRDETEWVELVKAGWNRVVRPTSSDAVFVALKRGLNSRGRQIRLYGDGSSANRIAKILHTSA
jgi:UDP-GlcNAc3NAcA epimerase